MNKILLTALLLFPLIINGQTINQSQLVGIWTAVDGNVTSTELPADLKKTMTLMIDGFKESTWNFNENGTFRIKFKENLSPVLEDLKFLDNKLWKLNESINQIRIGTNEDNYNHLILTPERIDSGINVYFSDTPIYLTLTKK